MAISDKLRRMDAHSGVSKEFRVYTVQGAVLSVVTVVGKCCIRIIYFIYCLSVSSSCDLEISPLSNILYKIHICFTSPVSVSVFVAIFCFVLIIICGQLSYI